MDHEEESDSESQSFNHSFRQDFLRAASRNPNVPSGSRQNQFLDTNYDDFDNPDMTAVSPKDLHSHVDTTAPVLAPQSKRCLIFN